MRYHGRKFPGKRAGMIENGVVSTEEDTREDDENKGGRYTGWFV